MPGFDDRVADLTLRKYHSRNPDDDTVEEGWSVEADGLDGGWVGESPSEALRVLAASLEDDDGAADIDELLEAEPPEDDDLWGDV